jgi:hypothetical protein
MTPVALGASSVVGLTAFVPLRTPDQARESPARPRKSLTAPRESPCTPPFLPINHSRPVPAALMVCMLYPLTLKFQVGNSTCDPSAASKTKLRFVGRWLRAGAWAFSEVLLLGQGWSFLPATWQRAGHFVGKLGQSRHLKGRGGKRT